MELSIQDKIEVLRKELLNYTNKDERLRFLIDHAKKMPTLPESEKEDKLLIEGCISKVWLKASYDSGKVVFMADSDAMMVKGIVSVLMRIYSGHTCDEILSNPPHFLTEAGISDHLSMNRRNGLANFIKQMNLYCVAFKAMY